MVTAEHLPCITSGVATKGLETHIGDLIQKAREKRGWNQAKLGEVAERFTDGAPVKKIDKSTVSRIERSPYGSDLATVWRLLAALNLTFCDVEHLIGNPFQDRHSEAKPARRKSAAS